MIQNIASKSFVLLTLVIPAFVTCCGCKSCKIEEQEATSVATATDVPETVAQDQSGNRIRVKYARVGFDFEMTVVMENLSDTPEVFDQCGLTLFDGNAFLSGVGFTWDNTQGGVSTRLKFFNDTPVRGERGNVQVTIRPHTSYHVTTPIQGAFRSAQDRRIGFGCFITSDNTSYVIGPFDEVTVK